MRKDLHLWSRASHSAPLQLLSLRELYGLLWETLLYMTKFYTKKTILIVCLRKSSNMIDIFIKSNKFNKNYLQQEMSLIITKTRKKKEEENEKKEEERKLSKEKKEKT